MTETTALSKLPERLIIVAGTYDGVIAGWDNVAHTKDTSSDNEDDDEGTTNTSKSMKNESLFDMLNNPSRTKEEEDAYLKMCFAMAVHDGSVRTLCISSMAQQQQKNKKDKQNSPQTLANTAPGSLLSAGYDESIAIFSLTKHVQSGELKTPSNLGTPTCSSFAPPMTNSPTHTLIGLSTGKVVIYRRKTWNVEHVLSGHDERGVNCIAVHPSGKMALTGGRDSKICLWDLMRGRIAFVYKIPPAQQGRKSTVNHIVWSDDGKRYAYCTHEGNITAREMETGEDLLDITLPSSGRANQISFIGGEDGLFLAAACNNGSLPVFAVGSVDENEEEEGTRRALMAIEPVEGVASACNDRFKCIRNIAGGSGFLVVTANSGGVVSVIDLEGAVRMMLTDSENESNDEETENENDSDDDDNSTSSDTDDFAAEILESVRVGSGARITSLAVWSASNLESDEYVSDPETEAIEIKSQEDVKSDSEADIKSEPEPSSKKRKSITTVPTGRGGEIEMDEEALEKARALVSKAKKRQKRKSRK